MKEQLEEAIKNKQNNINLFVWKYQNNNEVRLLDMNYGELQACYNHVMSMLYNDNVNAPGKYVVRKNINIIYDSCNAELFIRFILNDSNTILKSKKDILDFIASAKEQQSLHNSDSVLNLFNNLPSIFENVTIDKLMSACFDKLGILNKKLISNQFIISQGIWLTKQEKEDLVEYDDNGKLRNRLDVIKDRLVMTDVKLRVDPNGLNYSEFRSLVSLDNSSKISNLSTNTLKVLRDKVLLLLDDNLQYHIDKWTVLKTQIEKVAEHKKYQLVCRQY